MAAASGFKSSALFVLVGLAAVSTSCMDQPSLEQLQPVIQPIAAIYYGVVCSLRESSVTVPEVFPPALDAVVADPLRFDADDHPLRGVPLGTVIDGVSALDGCWGLHGQETGPNLWTDSPDDMWEVERFEVLRFNLAEGRLYHHIYEPSIPEEGLWLFGGTAVVSAGPTFVTGVFTVVVLDENTLSLEYLYGEGAAIEEDGTLVYHCLASNNPWSLGDGSILIGMMTIQGDSLKYVDVVGRPDDVLSEGRGFEEYEDYADLWVRFDCPPE